MSIENFKDYYEHLTELEKLNSPKELFANGNFSFLIEGRRVSVVGSREVSRNGAARAELVTKFLVQKDITIVSGLAKGVDTIAHNTTIKNGGRTISVLGTPLDQVYPKENKNLLEEIKKNHLAISQFPKGYPGGRKNFPMRNRTMALISDATIIIEASEKSGTKHQGWEALRLGRSLFILENIVNDKSMTWPKEMIKYGAQVLNRDNFEETIDNIPYLTEKLEYAF